MNDKEYCLYFRKGISLHTTYQTGKTYWITPTNVKDKKLYGHPTIKPIDIIKTLIQNSSAPGDVVFDCFLITPYVYIWFFHNSHEFIKNI